MNRTDNQQVITCRQPSFVVGLLTLFGLTALCACPASAAPLKAGAAKVDITNVDAGPVNDPLHARALVISDGDTTAVIISLDVVSIGQIGYVKNDYLDKVRGQLEKDLKIKPANVMINASHCHGIPCTDIAERTVKAVQAAAKNMVPVKIGVGTGHEDRVSENRRMKLKSGREADVRHAYSLPPDDEVVETGPIDPEIGILRLDKLNGETLAVVYNFAMHPIQTVPSGGNTADVTGFSSQVIEDNLSEGAIALFVQGCGGDINPVLYKDVDHPRNAEPLGNMLGLSTLKALRKIKSSDESRFKVINEPLTLPRADYAERIDLLTAEQDRLVKSLQGTTLNLKTFLPLMTKYSLSDEFPSYYTHHYLHEKSLGRSDMARHDAENRANMQKYMANIYTMEQLSRLQTNLALLRRHQAMNVASGKRTIDVEVVGVRLGDFVLVTFPGELTVRIGLGIKKRSPHPQTFVAGYTNGYIYYSPTADQMQNVGYAQEDSDCLLAPEWQQLFEDKVTKLLEKL